MSTTSSQSSAGFRIASAYVAFSFLVVAVLGVVVVNAENDRSLLFAIAACFVALLGVGGFAVHNRIREEDSRRR